ncbi:MAG: hypothetical protein HY342_03100 [Candidatus Lambdaproteobacteria bacterium]|nr:hypothetical protein [Candidatus Lambdaproteobacteria bacterium]
MHIITAQETGGAERALFNLLSGGLRERFHNLVLSLSDEGVFGPRLRELGVPVVRLRMRRGWPSPAAVFRLYRQVREHLRTVGGRLGNNEFVFRRNRP